MQDKAVISAPGITFTLCAASDVGRLRESNEDGFALSDAETGLLLTEGGACAIDGRKRVLLAVSDGMGGENAGEVASGLALQALRDRVAATLDDGPHQATLRRAFERANDVVTGAGVGPAREGMGATLVAALIDGAEAILASVGDSRAYLLRRGELTQLTRDQNLHQYLLERGGVVPEDTRSLRYRSVLLQAIGRAASLWVPVSRLSLRRHDRLLLCSDGLPSELGNDEIRFLLAGDLPPERIGANLVGAPNDRGGHDNITVALLFAEGADLVEPTPDESVAATVGFFDTRDDPTERAPRLESGR